MTYNTTGGGGLIVTFMSTTSYFSTNNMTNGLLAFCTVGLINGLLIGISYLLMHSKVEPPFEYNISTDAYTLCPSGSWITTLG